jgi:replication-associated recombination protein RarA
MDQGGPMSDSFSEIYRPKNPKQLIGETQRKVAQTLLDNVSKGKIIQEVLFSGDSGIGKTTIARMYIEAVLGQPYDGNPYNCGDKTGIDYVRNSINATINYLPLDSKYRVYFLDEIHKLSEEAQSGLLVTIEPVPEHVLFVACTTHPEKLIPTLRSRLTEFRLTSPSLTEFEKLAGWICVGHEKRTNTPCKLDEKTKNQVIGLSGGNARQFVRYLQQALDGSFNGDSIEKVPELELIKLIISGNQDLRKWLQAVDESADYVKQALGMVGYSAAVLKNGGGSSAKAAMAVIEHFGDSPTRNIDCKQTFLNRLIRVYKDIRS